MVNAATTNCAAQGGYLNMGYYTNSQGQVVAQNLPIGSAITMWPNLEVYTSDPYYPGQCTLQSDPNQIINFYLDGKSIGFAVTGQNGQAFLNYSTSNLSLGMHSYYAIWRANQTIVLNTSTIQVNIVKANTSISYAGNIGANYKNVFFPGGKLNLSITLFANIHGTKYAYGSINLVNQQVLLEANNQVLSTITTDSNGNAYFSVNPYTLSPGTYLFTMKYLGNPDYINSTTIIGNYTVPQPTTSSTSSYPTTVYTTNPTTTLNYTTPSNNQSSGGNGWLLPIIVVIIIVGIVYYFLTHRSSSPPSQHTSKPQPENIDSDDVMKTLKHRYAKGEITKKQFDRMKKDLEE